MSAELLKIYQQREERAKANIERIKEDLNKAYPGGKKYWQIAKRLKIWEITAGLWQGRAKEIECDERKKQ